MSFNVQKITKSDLKKMMLKYAFIEKWLYSSYDVDAYYSINKNSIFSLFKENHPIGCLSLFTYRCDDIKIVSAGLLLIKKEYRGQKNAALTLWRTCIASKMNENELWCLNSVERAVTCYERYGFYPTGCTNLSYSLDLKENSGLDFNLISSKNIQLLKLEDLPLIDHFEEQLFNLQSLQRKNLIQQWLKRPDATCLIYKKNGIIQGYGVSTICDQNNKVYRLSPVYGNSTDIIAEILQALIIHGIHKKITSFHLNTPRENIKKFGFLLEKFGFNQSDTGTTYLMTNFIDNNLKWKKNPYVFSLLPLEFPHDFIISI